MTDQAAREAKAATSAIPILFVLGADPVADGLSPQNLLVAAADVIE